MLCNQKGYALPLVLAISLIIMVISIGITLSVRQKITLAIELEDRSKAVSQAYSAMNEVLYNILTSPFTPTGLAILSPEDKENPSVIQTQTFLLQWNLYGEPIKINDHTSVRLRDVSGMVSPLFQPELTFQLLSAVSKAHRIGNSLAVNSFLDTLADWQDEDDLKRLNGAESWDYKSAGYSYGPRNFYLQVTEEMKLIKGFNKDLFDNIKDELAYWSGGRINYLTMSERLLRLLLQDDKLVDYLVKLRKDGILNSSRFSAVTGIWPEEGEFGPSAMIKIDITARVCKSVERIEAVIYRVSTQEQPFMVMEWKR